MVPLPCDGSGNVSGRRFRPAAVRQIGGPIVHELLPPFEEVRTHVGGLDPVLDDVCQRRLDDLVRMVGRLGLSGRRTLERTAIEESRRSADTCCSPRHGYVGQRLAAHGEERRRPGRCRASDAASPISTAATLASPGGCRGFELLVSEVAAG